MSGIGAGVLLTGGTGRLGSELQQLLPGIVAPGRRELDISLGETTDAAVLRYRPEVIVHAAAYTNVAAAERDKSTCWQVNVVGTRNLARVAAMRGLFFIHISTDYVFAGTSGSYSEDDPLGPTCNYYALTKLVAEESVRMVPKHLVIRTSFRPREWPYATAVSDVYTSQDYVDIIAPLIATAIKRYREIPYDTLHIATERKSVYDLAKRRKPDVTMGSKRELSVALPDDTSLNTTRWTQLVNRWKELESE